MHCSLVILLSSPHCFAQLFHTISQVHLLTTSAPSSKHLNQCTRARFDRHLWENHLLTSSLFCWSPPFWTLDFLLGPDTDGPSLSCVSPSLGIQPASECKADFEALCPLTGFSNKRGSLRREGVNKAEGTSWRTDGIVSWDSLSGVMLLPACWDKPTPPSVLVFKLHSATPWLSALLALACFFGTCSAALAAGMDSLLALDEACKLEVLDPQSPVGLFLKAESPKITWPS